MKYGKQHPGERGRRDVHRLCLALAIECAACGSNQAVPVGGGCSSDDTCSTGGCFRANNAMGQPTGWNGGYCSGSCASSSCPEGKCQSLADGNKYCLSSCSADGDCRSGYVCDKATSACLPDCRKGWSCGSTLSCNQSNGNCGPPSKTISVGGACTYDVSCTTGTCFFATDSNGNSTGWTDGYCSGSCASSSCPGGKCQSLADGNKYCLSSCSSDNDCRSGYVCDKTVTACLPDCRKGWSCGSTLTCNQTSGSCK